ncbi:mandelate racemase/muconate lactonizing enzyme family protein [Pseudactinotalea sp. HY158]|nr:mandelate racemase/muconate lactonizing enzyme family protein [Pseudactinotalea sp. HY158]
MPLPKGPWGDQIHHVTDIEILLVDITTDSGLVGTGFSHTSGVGGRTMRAMLDELTPTLIGKDVNPRKVWHEAWQYLRDNGPGGVTTLTLAAVDLALWDLLGKHHDLSLPALLGQVHDRIPLYGSGINLNLSVDELVEQVQEWKAAGFFAGKVKVGKPDIEEDYFRLRKIREAVGSYPLMIDANQGWTYARAQQALNRFADLDLYWVEEPFRVDDVVSHSRLKRHTATPIGLGENLYTLQQFNEYLTADACDFIQADLGRVGGITPYMDIAALGRAFNAPMIPHFVMELSATVLCAVPNALGAEMTDGGTLTELGVIEPHVHVDGYFVPRSTPGLGLEFNRALLSKNAI